MFIYISSMYARSREERKRATARPSRDCTGSFGGGRLLERTGFQRMISKARGSWKPDFMDGFALSGFGQVLYASEEKELEDDRTA
jgi:hypothetical protein